jgi:hypothetical protein
MEPRISKRFFALVISFVLVSCLYNLSAFGQNSGVWVQSDPLPKPSAGSRVISNVPPRRIWIWVENPSHGVFPLLPSQAAPSLTVPPVLPSPSSQISFNGVIDSPATGTPPDTHIAVGPGSGAAGRVVMVTNGHVQIWDKTGSVVASPVLLDTMFSATNFCFDPRVIYDEHSGRFFIACLDGTSISSSLIHIAVSSNDTPNDLSAAWTQWSASALTTFTGHKTWADYTNLGADDDSVIVTTNQFDNPGNFYGIKIRVFDKSALLAGSPVFTDLNFNNSSTPAFSVAPAHVYGTTDNGGFYLIGRLGATSYRYFNITGDPASPVASTNIYGWSTGSDPSNSGAPQPGTSVNLDAGDARVMSPIYRNGHIWLCLTADPDNDGLTEVVWQDILTNGGPPAAPTINQGGFLKGTDTSCWTYTPSIAVNSAGDAAMCFTQSSSTEYPDVVYAARSVNDSPGTFRSPVIAKAGSGYYDSFYSGNPDRWGDYSACVLDPTDDSFWVANEFAWTSLPANSDWATFIAGFNPPIVGDFDIDGGVNFIDFALFAQNWQLTSSDPNWNPVFDISVPKDNVIDFFDLEVFSQNWLKGFP